MLGINISHISFQMNLYLSIPVIRDVALLFLRNSGLEIFGSELFFRSSYLSSFVLSVL